MPWDYLNVKAAAAQGETHPEKMNTRPDRLTDSLRTIVHAKTLPAELHQRTSAVMRLTDTLNMFVSMKRTRLKHDMCCHAAGCWCVGGRQRGISETLWITEVQQSSWNSSVCRETWRRTHTSLTGSHHTSNTGVWFQGISLQESLRDAIQFNILKRKKPSLMFAVFRVPESTQWGSTWVQFGSTESPNWEEF